MVRLLCSIDRHALAGHLCPVFVQWFSGAQTHTPSFRSHA
jgi:hypothetical protein